MIDIIKLFIEIAEIVKVFLWHGPDADVVIIVAPIEG